MLTRIPRGCSSPCAAYVPPEPPPRTWPNKMKVERIAPPESCTDRPKYAVIALTLLLTTFLAVSKPKWAH